MVKSGVMKRLWLVLMMVAALGFVSWLMPTSASAQCCDKTCVDSDGDDFEDDSIACNQLLLKGVGKLTGCLDLGLLCEGGQFLSKKPILAPLYPLLSGCLCLLGGCSPAGEEACAASAAEACLAGGNAKTVKDDPACGPVVPTIMCEPVTVTQTHGGGFFENSHLGKVVNGKIPCAHSETAAVAECVFNPSNVSWLESPSGTYVLMGQATSPSGAIGNYVTAAHTSAEGTSPCVESTSGDSGGLPSATPLGAGCQVETLLSATNRSGALLENFADIEVCSSDQVHPDAHNGGPVNTGCFVNVNGGTSCCWTGEGAALNDVSGRERGEDGRYLPESHHCHLISLSQSTNILAAKRPATMSGPQVDPTTPIVWRPVSPLVSVANGGSGGTGVSACVPVEVTQVHLHGFDAFHPVYEFLGNSRLAKIVDGKVPCLGYDTLEVGECAFDPDKGSWLESPSGNYALIGQAVYITGYTPNPPDPNFYIIGTHANAAGQVPCVDPSSLDGAGTSTTGTLSADCIIERANFTTNTSGKPLLNYADQNINGQIPHPDAHEGGPTTVGGCSPTQCTYTGEGAALNDIYGTERDANGVYYTGVERCHMILHSGIMVPGSKRTKVFVDAPIQWLPEYPIGNFANGS